MTLTIEQVHRIAILIASPLSAAIANSIDKSLSQDQRDQYLREAEVLRDLLRIITSD